MVSDNSGREHYDDQEPGKAHHRFRYGSWRGGPGRSDRRLTCVRPSTRSVRTCSRQERYATPCEI